MAKARAIPDLDPGDPYRVVAARVIEVRMAEVLEHADGVRDLGEIENLHSMRVATRRLRAALEIFRPCFDAEAFKPALADVKALADALGERRDRDVALELLDEFAEGLPAADRRGVGGLVDEFRDEQIVANDAIEPWVAPERLAALSERVEGLVR